MLGGYGNSSLSVIIPLPNGVTTNFPNGPLQSGRKSPQTNTPSRSVYYLA